MLDPPAAGHAARWGHVGKGHFSRQEVIEGLATMQRVWEAHLQRRDAQQGAGREPRREPRGGAAAAAVGVHERARLNRQLLRRRLACGGCRAAAACILGQLAGR